MPNVNNSLVIGEFQSVFLFCFLILVLVFSFNPRPNPGTAQWAQKTQTPEETFSLYTEDQEFQVCVWGRGKGESWVFLTCFLSLASELYCYQLQQVGHIKPKRKPASLTKKQDNCRKFSGFSETCDLKKKIKSVCLLIPSNVLPKTQVFENVKKHQCH